MEPTPGNRRNFLCKTGTIATAVAAASLVTVPNPAQQPGNVIGSNERVRIGFIGVGSRGFKAHVRTLRKLAEIGENIELAAVCDVYSVHRDRAASYIREQTGRAPQVYVDYTDLLADGQLDAVCIGTPDHWHARQTSDALRAGKHVYCEKPMTHTIDEALTIVREWEASGRVMQVGVQSTSLPVWNKCRELIQQGMLGKLLMFQTEFFRNSPMGQWRYYPLEKEMTPRTIDWPRWLGVKEGLAEAVPFDREIFAQWRRFWPYAGGVYTDLFVHRVTSMLKATGLRYPRRVAGAGGIYFEYDGRDVPDVATVVADYEAGVQGLVTATMASEECPIKQCIRGHFGSFEFGTSELFTGCDFIAERRQVTHSDKICSHRIETGGSADSTQDHLQNWLRAIRANQPDLCNNPPDLGAAAVVTVTLGSRSYREGKIFFWDAAQETASDTDPGWAARWEQMSRDRARPHQVPGWTAGDLGSTLDEPAYMSLAGPWQDGQPQPRIKGQ